jgi:light-regulated signal transduction histidine kinase (bacteriophytochrome)
MATDSTKESRIVNAELHIRLQERTAQLEAANREVEAFAYSVSHDLRAPLRAIRGFSQVLMEEYAPQLPEEAQHYFQVIRDNALQMGELIDALLTFSRLGRQPLQRESMDMSELAWQAFLEVKPEEVKPEIEPRIDMVVRDLLVCQGDRVLIKQVLVNLLSNAIKYTRGRATASIEVGIELREPTDAAIYYVRDNGVGFDMRYVHNLFGAFQRLHSSDDYAGIGMGLATVRRIVHRHGGRVWAEGKVDAGATFYFTLEPEATALGAFVT